MPKMRSVVIALTLLAVVAASAIVFVIWIGPGRSGTSSRGATSSAAAGGGGISAVAGGITWLGLSVVVGAGLAVCLGLAACVALLVSGVHGRRDESG